jgi:hypothetical protein
MDPNPLPTDSTEGVRTRLSTRMSIVSRSTAAAGATPTSALRPAAPPPGPVRAPPARPAQAAPRPSGGRWNSNAITSAVAGPAHCTSSGCWGLRPMDIRGRVGYSHAPGGAHVSPPRQEPPRPSVRPRGVAPEGLARMADPSYFDAQMQEHGAEPAHQFTGPNKSPVMRPRRVPGRS